jgi:hypothetical protein
MRRTATERDARDRSLIYNWLQYVHNVDKDESSVLTKDCGFQMKIISSLLILSFWCISPHLSYSAEVTCQDGDPTKLCCMQWKMELSGGKGMLLDNTYNTLIADRNNTDQKNQRWCSQGDQHFCGITFGPPQCSGNRVSIVKPSDPCDEQPLAKRDLCKTVTKLREECQRTCTQWDTVSGQWVCFVYGPPPVRCHPPIAHPVGGGFDGIRN